MHGAPSPPVTAAAPPSPTAMPTISAVVGAPLPPPPPAAAGALVVVRGGLDAAGAGEALAVGRGRRSAGGAAVPEYTASRVAWLTDRPAGRQADSSRGHTHGQSNCQSINPCVHIAASTIAWPLCLPGAAHTLQAQLRRQLAAGGCRRQRRLHRGLCASWGRHRHLQHSRLEGAVHGRQRRHISAGLRQPPPHPPTGGRLRRSCCSISALHPNQQRVAA